MPYRPKTFLEKLNSAKGLPKVVKIKGRLSKYWGKGTLVIASPKEVAGLMKKVPQGRLVTINQIREVLAKKYQTTIACPITTGIFARIAAGAAEEERATGRKNITPYWRLLKQGGEINPKYPGGITAQKKLLEQEGHQVVQKGRRALVKNFEAKLVKAL